MLNNLVIVRGGGDLATGIIHKLHRCGFEVLVLEIEKPLAIRRKVSFSEAIYEGRTVVEDVPCAYGKTIDEIKDIFNKKEIAITVDPIGEYIEKLKPSAVIDSILAKKNLGTNMNMAPITIGVGPGFYAGKDVNVVIETNRGHNLGRLIFKGEAEKNTGIPGVINGYSKERVIYSNGNGIINTVKDIGSVVKKGEVLAYVNGKEILATIDGILRGIIRNGSAVKENLKIIDIDPRYEELKNCFTISDKSRAIGGSALEAILYFQNKYKRGA